MQTFNDKFILIINSIDWIFAIVMLVGGWFWGTKYFKISKVEALNFLGFATAAGVCWLIIKYFTIGIPKNEVANLFITYLFTTSFYEVLAKHIFSWLTNWVNKGKVEKPATVIKVQGGEVTEIKEIPAGTKEEQKKEADKP